MKWETTTMERTTHIRTLGLAALLASTSLFAGRGTLQADGLLNVKGASTQTTTVRVVPAGAAAYVLPIGSTRFLLELPVDDRYLVSFERAGCPTKEVYFDTTVPVEYAANDFTFRFKVTLEHMEAEQLFTYAGPVGFVRYMHPLVDFGYETNYEIKVNEELHERMKEFKDTGVDPKVILAPAVAMVIDRPRNGEPIVTHFLPEQGELAPIVREVPPMVNYLEDQEDNAQMEAVMSASNKVALEIVQPKSTEVETSIERPMPKAAAIVILEPLANLTVKQDVTTGAEPMVGSEWIERDEELVIEDRKVLKVIRLTHSNGGVDELRKVVHAYGAIFYFHNSQSISADRFEALSAQR